MTFSKNFEIFDSKEDFDPLFCKWELRNLFLICLERYLFKEIDLKCLLKVWKSGGMNALSHA